MSFDSALAAHSPLLYAKLAEASGSTLVDSSGLGHDGTYPVAPTFGVASLLPSDSDTMADFQGPSAGGHAVVADAAWMNTNHFTIFAWIKRESTSATGYIISRDGNGGSNRDWRLFLNNSTGRLDFGVWNAAGTVVTLNPSTVLANNTGYFVVAKYDGTNMKLFVDGVQIGTVAHTGNTRQTAYKICIGSFNEGTSTRFNGVMGKVGYIGTAISDADILALYNAGIAPPPSTLDLAGTLAAPDWTLTGDYDLEPVAPPADVTLDGELTAPAWTLTGAYQFIPAAPVDITLDGALSAPDWTLTGDYDLDPQIVPELALAGTLAAPDWSLAGDYQLAPEVLDPSIDLAGALAAPVWTIEGAYALVLPPQTDLGRVSSRRRSGYGIATWTPPVVPIPAPPGGYSMVTAQAFGPQTMQGTQPVFTISEATIPRTRQRILIGGVDFTNFRDIVTPDVRYTLIEPLLYGPADLDLPQVLATEPLGVGDLAPLRKFAPVIVQDVLDDVVVRTAYKGFINGFGVDGLSRTFELGGEGQGAMELQDRQPVVVPRVNDIGHQIAVDLGAAGLQCHPPLGRVTGIETMTTGGTGLLEHFNGLHANAWTRAGRQWTTMPDPVTGVYETHRKDGTTIHATAFIDDAHTVLNVRRDISDEHTRVFGSGVTPTGMRVSNAIVPGLYQGPVPPFPGHMEMGDTGDGVRLLIGRLHAMGFLGLRDTPGGYDEDVYDAVVRLQNNAGLFDEGFVTPAVPGEVGIRTWEALYDLDITSASLEWAHIEPMAQDPKVQEWLRAGSGTIMRANPRYDAAEKPVDRTIDYGSGLRRGQMFEHSHTSLHDADEPNWLGELTLHTGALLRGEVAIGATVTAEDVMEDKELLPGMNVWVPNFEGGTLFHVAAGIPDEEGVFTFTVDTRFRDAQEAWEVMERNKEARRDPARRAKQRHRSSTIVKDSIGEWFEHGGILGHDIHLEPGWNVIEVTAAMEGTISRMRFAVQTVTTEGETISIEGHEFVCAVFGQHVTPGWLTSVVPAPLTADGKRNWRRRAPRAKLRERWILCSFGTDDEPCGYGEDLKSDGAELTGEFDDDAGFAYRSESRTRLYLAVWVGDDAEDAIIPAGRIMWPQLEAGV